MSLYEQIVEKIKDNKERYNIDYKETILALRGILREIEKEYEEMED